MMRGCVAEARHIVESQSAIQEIRMDSIQKLGLGLLLAVAAVGAQAADGEVRKIDLNQGKITLKHGEIRKLEMPAMTMVFRVRDKAALAGLAVGDRVRFDAEKIDGQYTVTSIQKLH
jgi:Cu(I)/Ag(I) efflux system periplasmic protein CusF